MSERKIVSGTGFVHLRTHSDHSLLEGMMSAGDMVKRVAADGQPALAITNRNNMFDALALASDGPAAGVQPIQGMSVDMEGGGSIVLLAQSETGWRSLCALSERMWMRPYNDNPVANMQDLADFSEDVICLSGGAYGPAGAMLMKNHDTDAAQWHRDMAAIYGTRFYVEIQRHPDENGLLTDEEDMTEDRLLDIAYDLDLPIVATNDARFLSAELRDAHDAIISIGEKTSMADPKRRQYRHSHALRSAEEMRELFADLPEACDRTLEVAMRCAFKTPKLDPILPRFADDEVNELRTQAREGLKKRLEVIPHAADVKEYEDRLEFELGIIEQMGFPGYFLIVADFIKWAKDQDIPVGPGRGSGAGSLVAYALTITDLDPLRYSLLFERFLNPERVSMPDFDIDFCMDRREEVIEYVRHKYGEDRVGQIITFGGMLSKMTIKDVGRAMGLPYGQLDRLSKLIPVKGVKPVSIAEALKMEPRLVEEGKRDERVKRALELAEQVEESTFRSAGTHAAGVVIADRPLRDLVPVYRDAKSPMPATQFNMSWVEKAGLVKFDFLGLKTLTVIKKALGYIEDGGWGKVDIDRIPIDDKASYDLMAAAETVSVFQIESPGMMDALRRMKPTCIEDIIALVALYRPGPMENIPTYCEVKNGLRPLASIHESIDPILKETQGIIVYQEQVMQIAQVMAGYTLGGADLLRRAMGKKKPEEMAKERPKFIEGCAKTHGVSAEKAGEVFDLLEKFANYGFNKSHAAAYAYIAYQTAWLKTHYPVEFMAGVMACELGDTDKLAKARGEMVRMGIDITPPDINHSKVSFSVRDGSVVYALSALKGVGAAAVSHIVAEREANGAYRSMEDLAARVDLRKVGKSTLEALARAGAFGSIEPDRAMALALCAPAFKMSVDIRDDKKVRKGQAAADLFDLAGGHGSRLEEKLRPEGYKKLSHSETMSLEVKAIGFHLSGHPLDRQMGTLERAGITPISQIPDLARGKRSGTIAGTVVSVEEKPTRNGNKFLIAIISDPGGTIEITAFGESLRTARELCKPGNNLIFRIRATADEETIRVSMNTVETMDSYLGAGSAMDILIEVENEAAVQLAANELGQPGKGEGSVSFLVKDQTTGRVTLINAMENVAVNAETLERLNALEGIIAKPMGMDDTQNTYEDDTYLEPVDEP